MNNCPWCDADIQKYLETDLTDKVDIHNEFEDDCPKCEKIIKVEVDWSPVFYITKLE